MEELDIQKNKIANRISLALKNIPKGLFDILSIKKKIMRNPPICDFERGELEKFPDKFIDLRSYDLRKIDIKDKSYQLKDALYDDKTQRPEKEQLPEWFDPEKTMELNKNPWLGIRELHEQGITWKWVNVAIIDQTLLVDHKEYKNNIQFYYETKDRCPQAEMHGPAVASLAVGKSVWVAPDAGLYYIAEKSDDPQNFAIKHAKLIEKIIKINTTLSDDKKIRALSMSETYDKQEKESYDIIMASIEKAKKAWIFVITGDLDELYWCPICGLDKDLLADPDDVNSYLPAITRKNKYNPDMFNFLAEKNKEQEVLLAPMWSRSMASPTGNDDYVFYARGWISRVVPYIAWIYALACQVYPKITPELFLKIAKETWTPINKEQNGNNLYLGKIINPQKLINEIKKLS